MLVFILAITQAAIRAGRDGAGVEDTMTLAELRAALAALRDVETAMRQVPETPAEPPAADSEPQPETGKDGGKVHPLTGKST